MRKKINKLKNENEEIWCWLGIIVFMNKASLRAAIRNKKIKVDDIKRFEEIFTENRPTYPIKTI